ncbi:MAG: S8 family peptidase [Chloroflexi bacterium]|nr:S8 family peptidase [Chloroflexota bacterium]
METKKLCPRLAVRLDVVESEDKLPLIVKLNTNYDSKAILASTPFQHLFKLTPMASLVATKREIETLSRHPHVERIWMDLPVHACLDASVPQIGAPKVWESGFTGKGVKVAVIDTGIDTNHPDLAGQVKETHDFTGEGFQDLNGHGTHVAGIIAGTGSKYRGVAPGSTLVGVKVLKGDGSGMTSATIAGVEWAVEKGVQIINLSLGSSGGCDGSDALSLTCDAAVDLGIVVCVAAGNDGPWGGSVGSPGCARKVITVGASTENDLVADFSSRGPTQDGRIKPDVVFPGHNIVSCRAKGTSIGNVISDLYTEASGTSMATPHATGAVALLLESKRISSAEIKDLLMGSAKDLGLSPNIQGYGRGDVYDAYQGKITPRPLPPVPEPIPGNPTLPGCLPQIFRSWRLNKGV